MYHIVRQFIYSVMHRNMRQKEDTY